MERTKRERAIQLGWRQVAFLNADNSQASETWKIAINVAIYPTFMNLSLNLSIFTSLEFKKVYWFIESEPSTYWPFKPFKRVTQLNSGYGRLRN